MNKERLGIKDLVSIGIFSTIYMVISIVTMILAMFSPMLWLLWPAIAGLVCSFAYIFLVVKVPKKGTAFLLSVITGILYFVTGECTWVIVVTFAIVGITAEITRKIIGYKNNKSALISSGIVSIGFIGSPLPMWLFQERYMKSIIEMGMSVDYVEKMQQMISAPSLIIMIIIAYFGGMIGGIIGSKMFKKSFEKAGIL